MLTRMKTFKNILLIAGATVFMVACKNKVAPEIETVETETANVTAKTFDPNAVFAKTEFRIEGMTCEIGCARTIERKITKMEGVKYAKVDFNKKMAMVEYDQDKVTPADLEETVAKAGKAYKVKDMKTVERFSDE